MLPYSSLQRNHRRQSNEFLKTIQYITRLPLYQFIPLVALCFFAVSIMSYVAWTVGGIIYYNVFKTDTLYSTTTTDTTTAISINYVLDIPPAQYYTYVSQAQPAFVEFYAPWCHHCQAFKPELITIAETLHHADSDINIVAVNGDLHRDFAEQLDIDGFPTLMYYAAYTNVSEMYKGKRDAEHIIEFLNEKHDTSMTLTPPTTQVVELTPDTFDAVVYDHNKHVMVEFYAPWCSHCKALKPVYAQVAETYAHQPNVIIAAIDADKYRDYTENNHSIEGYPTIRLYGMGDDQTAKDYRGDKSLSAMIDYVNTESGAERTAGGGYSATFGRIAVLDKIAEQFKATQTNEQRTPLIAEAQAALLTDAVLHSPHSSAARYYALYMKHITVNDAAWIGSEVGRIDRLLSQQDAKLNDNQVELLHKRRNIASTLSDAITANSSDKKDAT